MKALILGILLLSTFCVFADTYTGVVAGVKHFPGGAVAVDMDGKYPNEKMVFYIPAADIAAVGTLPAEGTKITATGNITKYKGTPEIKILSKNQWSW